MRIHQLVFGYRDGHRQLAGSTELSRDLASVLLGATDAATTSKDDRLITGVPLPKADMYALSLTWSAPEAGRPGAVWAHTLLVPFSDLSRLSQPASLLRYARRPQGLVPEGYGESISVDPTVRVAISPDPFLLTQLVEAGSEAGGARAFVHPDLHEAEDTLLFLWGAMWPVLRMTFAFRTRDAIRSSSDVSYFAVARQIRGLVGKAQSGQRNVSRQRRNGRTPPPWWIAELTGEPGGGGLVDRFLLEFGPDEPADLRSFRYLGELCQSVVDEDVTAVAKRLGDRHPKPESGQLLKVALFGQPAEMWWRVPELRLVMTVLSTSKGFFDAKALDLTERLRNLIRQGHVSDLVSARARSGPKLISNALVDALVREGSVEIIHTVLNLDETLAIDVLRQRDDLLSDPKFWRLLSPADAAIVLSKIALSPKVISAAARAGQFKPLLQMGSFNDLIQRLANAGRLGLVRQAVEALPREAAVAADSSDQTRILLGAAATRAVGLQPLLQALENRRDAPTEYWLRSAVNALTTAKPEEVPKVLEVVFGPLHSAISEDRLPRDLSSQLDSMLPKANDPARRLRRLLVDVARRGEWSKRGVERALRNSGPFVEKLGGEVDHKDSAWRLIRSGLKSLKRP